MPRGYAEGPAAEAAEARAEALERGESLDVKPVTNRSAVYGCTDDNPERHFIGWRGEVDPDALFNAGKAWGLVVRRAAE